jgi:hypothetical protein
VTGVRFVCLQEVCAEEFASGSSSLISKTPFNCEEECSVRAGLPEANERTPEIGLAETSASDGRLVQFVESEGKLSAPTVL